MDGRVAATGRVRHACFSGRRPAAFSRGNTHDPVACRGELRGTAALTGGTPRCGCTGASRQRMSARKGATLRAIDERFVDGRLSDEVLAEMSDDEDKAALHQVTGVWPSPRTAVPSRPLGLPHTPLHHSANTLP